MTKATNKEKSEPKYSQNWLLPKRGMLKFFDDHLSLDSWKFYFDKI